MSDRHGNTTPTARFIDKPLAADLRELIEASFAIVLRSPPFCDNCALCFQPLQGRIKGTVIHQEFILRCFLDRSSDSLPVLPAEQQRAEDQQIQSALQQGETILLIFG